MPSFITTYDGKSADSLPNPYVVHDPMLGKPGHEWPVCQMVSPTEWIAESV